VRTVEDLQAENEILRKRIEQLESGSPSRADPVLRAFLQHMPSFLNVITPDGRFLATGRTSEAFGSVVGRSVFEFSVPEHHEAMRAVYAQACATKQPQVYESIGYAENGEPDHVYLVRAVPLVENDEVTAIALVPADITDRVKLERSLAESERKLRLAVTATGIGLWSWDIARDEVKWDERALEIFGLTSVPPSYEKYLNFVHPDDREQVQKVVNEALETGIYRPFEHRLTPRPDGVERWLLAIGTLVRNDKGEPAGLMGGALDITEQKRLAAQLQQVQRVEALGQLTAGLAHNFNNLLMAITPNLELVLQQAPEELSPLLTAALDASLQARDLIKRLMSITGRTTTTTSNSSSPQEVIGRAFAICRATFPREIELVSTVHSEVGHVGMEASDLEQVVLNLLFNARDALERKAQSPRKIEVILDAITINGEGRARLRVRDSGPGMSRAVLERIFEPFFTTKSGQRGSGLGLSDALVRVRAAGGTLECISEEGAGATFTLLLPMTSPPAVTSLPAEAAPAGSRGEAILLVDDEPAVRKIVARILAREGYIVIEAEDTDAARALLSQHGDRVKLVLLDQSMPRESGPEALPSLKRLSNAPVVMFSGTTMVVPPGASAVLEKPTTVAQLLRTVEQLIQKPADLWSDHV
jgi:two-component system cell cycle sensor histidine kinase/response regulator CckA